MSLCKRFKKRSRNWQAWYTKICIKQGENKGKTV